jgi:hypothetical protein
MLKNQAKVEMASKGEMQLIQPVQMLLLRRR